MKLQTIEQILNALNEGKTLSELILKLPTVNTIRWDKNNPFHIDMNGAKEIRGALNSYDNEVEKIFKSQSKKMGNVAKKVKDEIMLLWNQSVKNVWKQSVKNGYDDCFNSNVWGWMMQDVFDCVVDYYVMLCDADNDSDDLRQVKELLIGLACDVYIAMHGFLDINFCVYTLNDTYSFPFFFFMNFGDLLQAGPNNMNDHKVGYAEYYEKFYWCVEEFEDLIKGKEKWIQHRKNAVKKHLRGELIEYEYCLEPYQLKSGEWVGILKEEEIEEIISMHIYFKENGWTIKNWIDELIEIRQQAGIEIPSPYDFEGKDIERMDKFGKEFREKEKKYREERERILTDMATGNINISDEKRKRIEKSNQMVDLLVRTKYITHSDGEDLKKWLRMLICQNEIHKEAREITVKPKEALCYALYSLKSCFWGRGWKTTENDKWEDFMKKVSGKQCNFHKAPTGPKHDVLVREIKKIAPPKTNA